jgi:hypothetical protein
MKAIEDVLCPTLFKLIDFLVYASKKRSYLSL